MRPLVAFLIAGMAAAAALGQPEEDAPPTTADWVIIEGDILMPPDGQRSFHGNSWPDGIVPFQFDGSAGITASERAAMLSAMDWWTTPTGVKFVYRTAQANYLLIARSTDAGVSSSAVGMVGGGQEVRIWNTHWNNTGLVAHELCHALGFWHEQSRPDRDDFVRIEWQNIADEREPNFEIRQDSSTLGSPYDYLSIMHYSACAFSECSLCIPLDAGCRSITTLDPGYQMQIGQRSNLSALDIQDMVDVYGPRTARYVAVGGGGSGTLSSPFPTIQQGMAAIPSGGTLLIQNGSYSSPGSVVTARCVWRAHGGSAVIQ